MKDNAKAEVQDVIFENPLKKDEDGVYRIEHIHLKYKKEKNEKILCLRLDYYRHEQGRSSQSPTFYTRKPLSISRDKDEIKISIWGVDN